MSVFGRTSLSRVFRLPHERLPRDRVTVQDLLYKKPRRSSQQKFLDDWGWLRSSLKKAVKRGNEPLAQQYRELADQGRAFAKSKGLQVPRMARDGSRRGGPRPNSGRPVKPLSELVFPKTAKPTKTPRPPG